jgi:hypothetical protein
VLGLEGFILEGPKHVRLSDATLAEDEHFGLTPLLTVLGYFSKKFQCGMLTRFENFGRNVLNT